MAGKNSYWELAVTIIGDQPQIINWCGLIFCLWADVAPWFDSCNALLLLMFPDICCHSVAKKNLITIQIMFCETRTCQHCKPCSYIDQYDSQPTMDQYVSKIYSLSHTSRLFKLDPSVPIDSRGHTIIFQTSIYFYLKYFMSLIRQWLYYLFIVILHFPYSWYGPLVSWLYLVLL